MYHKHLNKLILHHMNQIFFFLRKEKILVFKRIWFNKIAIMYEKVKFSEIKESISIALIETPKIRNILSIRAVSNRIVIVKLESRS